MTQLVKQNGKWITPSNTISQSIFEENNDNTPVVKDLRSYVYLPVHNIRDIYEWYRLYKDAYLGLGGAAPLDPKGYGIEAYFDNKRGASLKGWFPNLVEVKAATSDVVVYENVFGTYTRRSRDYKLNFNVGEDLIIDNVPIYTDELILIKNQQQDILNFYNIDLLLSDIPNNIIFIQAVSGDEQYFNIGNTLVMLDSINETTETKILEISYEDDGVNTFIKLIVENAFQCISVADRDSGTYTEVKQFEQHGVYKYTGTTLVLCDFMNDKYKTDKQIVYVYQGETNQNVDFYLRRSTGDINIVMYGLFPTNDGIEPLIYSRGDAYLVKCEFNYDISWKVDPDVIPTECCGCQQTQNIAIEHPLGFNFDEFDDPYRLIFMDPTQSKSLISTSAYGPGRYYMTNTFLFNDIVGGIQFATMDQNGAINALGQMLFEIFIGAPLSTDGVATFQPVYLDLYESLSPVFSNQINQFLLTQDEPNNTTQLQFLYEPNQYKFPVSYNATGSAVRVQITKQQGTSDAVYMYDELHLITNYVMNNIVADITVFPMFDTNMYNELVAMDYGSDHVWEMTMTLVNFYDNTDGLNVGPTIKSFIKMLNQTPVGKLYNFNFLSDVNAGTTEVQLNGIRMSKYVYLNHTTSINYGSGTIDILHERNIPGNQYNLYEPGYNISKHTNYLDITDYNAREGSVIFQSHTVEDDDMCVILPNPKGTIGLNTFGSIIKFGKNHRETVLDSLKTDTYVAFHSPPLSPSSAYVFIEKIEDDGEIVTVYTLTFVPLVANTIFMKFTLDLSISDISSIIEQANIAYPNESYSPLTTAYPPYNIDTVNFAHMLSRAEDQKDGIFNRFTGLMFKEFGEPRVKFFKRDRYFNFDEDPIVDVSYFMSININILSAPVTLNGTPPNIGDVIILNNQTVNNENGVYIFDGPGNPLILYPNPQPNTYWRLIDDTFVSLPSPKGGILFQQKTYRRKKDPRLTLRPVGIAKLGVDNATQPFKLINAKYDMAENEEGIVIIQPGINNIYSIRFIDGLTQYNILNNINGQGQYAWILADTVITENAVVGCTQEFGPGTGDLIWYTGTWVQGVWCDGIWIQGHWMSGTWMNGTHNAYGIQDNNIYITYNNQNNHLLSTWDDGTWVNGTWNGGIATYITWIDGTFNDGIIIDGTWKIGTFNSGIIKHVVWDDGLFTGGDFETGLWKDGVLDELSPGNPARFGVGSTQGPSYRTRAIWRTGRFIGGEFMTGDNAHNSSIFYSGTFTSGTFTSGSFVSGIFNAATWNNGVWFGGYNATLAQLVSNQVQLTLNPTQFDSILGLTGLAEYQSNIAHNQALYVNEFYMIATPITPGNLLAEELFVNVCDMETTAAYIAKDYLPGSASNTTMVLDDITSLFIEPSYVVENVATNTPSGSPILVATFNGNWNGGIWLNGVFLAGTFAAGHWANGHFRSGTFGTI